MELLGQHPHPHQRESPDAFAADNALSTSGNQTQGGASSGKIRGDLGIRKQRQRRVGWGAAPFLPHLASDSLMASSLTCPEKRRSQQANSSQSLCRWPWRGSEPILATVLT